MNEKARQYFERAREEASREAFLEIRQNDFKFKAQWISCITKLEFQIVRKTVGIDIKTNKSVNFRNSKHASINRITHKNKKVITQIQCIYFIWKRVVNMKGKSEQLEYLFNNSFTPRFS